MDVALHQLSRPPADLRILEFRPSVLSLSRKWGGTKTFTNTYWGLEPLAKGFREVEAVLVDATAAPSLL